MAQQISVEDAFPTFRQRCRELFEENLLLRAQVDVLERQLAEAQNASPASGVDETGPPLFADEQRS
ncbi:hypothetical protein [Streptomyces sp. N35]|uniref:hypothetical protein n=1 Tax=Streptomyces sp. N35 TaxID=2795730 RepID=UPI0018F7C979|nr:hypothetical protein [Streptomyces sp. N35]